MDAKIKVLFLASNPQDSNQLNLDEEIRSITSKLRASEYRGNLDLVSAWAVRPDDLLQQLNEHKPVAVHFSGHGSKAGELILMNDLRQTKPVTPTALKALFTALKDNVKLVFLNACYSEHQSNAIADVIDCVIGMNDAISDAAAIVFASSFYRAIGFNRSVKEAFEQGKASLLLEGIDENDTPVLLTRRDVDPASVFLLSSGNARSQDHPALPAKIEKQVEKLLLEIRLLSVADELILLVNNNPEAKDEIVNLLIQHVSGKQKFRNSVERHNIYYTLGKIGGQHSMLAIEKGLNESDEFALRGARQAWKAINSSLQ